MNWTIDVCDETRRNFLTLWNRRTCWNNMCCKLPVKDAGSLILKPGFFWITRSGNDLGEVRRGGELNQSRTRIKPFHADEPSPCIQSISLREKDHRSPPEERLLSLTPISKSMHESTKIGRIDEEEKIFNCTFFFLPWTEVPLQKPHVYLQRTWLTLEKIFFGCFNSSTWGHNEQWLRIASWKFNLHLPHTWLSLYDNATLGWLRIDTPDYTGHALDWVQHSQVAALSYIEVLGSTVIATASTQ